MSLGAPKSERGRSQGQGLLFRGDRQGVRRSRSAGPKDGGGAETLQGRKAEAEDRRAAGRGQAGVWPSSEAVPERLWADKERTETVAVELFSNTISVQEAVRSTPETHHGRVIRVQRGVERAARHSERPATADRGAKSSSRLQCEIGWRMARGHRDITRARKAPTSRDARPANPKRRRRTALGPSLRPDLVRR